MAYLTATPLFSTPTCCSCKMLSDSDSTYYRDDEMVFFCQFCRQEMEEEVTEIANELLTDPKVLSAYKSYGDDVRDELLIQLAEEIYFFGNAVEDEEIEDEVTYLVGMEN